MVVLETILIIGILVGMAVLFLAVMTYHTGPIATLFCVAGSVCPILPWWFAPSDGKLENDIANAFFGVGFMIAAMTICFLLSAWFGDKFQKRHPRRWH